MTRKRYAAWEMTPRRRPNVEERITGVGVPAALLLAATLPGGQLASVRADTLDDPRSEAQELQHEIEALHREQQRIDKVYRASERRIRELEERIAALEAAKAGDADTSVAESSGAKPAPVEQLPAVRGGRGYLERLRPFGDFRLRYESTSGEQGRPDRDQGVLRARLGATYAVNDFITLGGRIVTGDPGDPNSTDVTLGNFVDDLDVSLDQAYATFQSGGLTLTGGKFANPFLNTELVWDGDVNPQGVMAGYRFPIIGSFTAGATGLYFLVDEDTVGPDSAMAGGQAHIEIMPAEDWRLLLAGAYYDYDLDGLRNADSGDIRGNLLSPGGSSYRSDFNLADAIGAVEYRGLGQRWPVRLTVDYVHNLGAETGEDEGAAFELSLGRAQEAGEFRFSYGYSWAETDAVLAAFSHDNTTLATNYRQHTLNLDYVPWDKLLLNLTWYLYRADEQLTVAGPDPDDLIHRLRLNVSVSF